MTARVQVERKAEKRRLDKELDLILEVVSDQQERFAAVEKGYEIVLHTGTPHAFHAGVFPQTAASAQREGSPVHHP